MKTKITGLKKVVSELKNAQFGAIYLNRNTGKLEAYEQVSQNFIPYNVNEGFEHIDYIGSYNRQYGQLTMDSLRDMVREHLNDTDQLDNFTF